MLALAFDIGRIAHARSEAQAAVDAAALSAAAAIPHYRNSNGADDTHVSSLLQAFNGTSSSSNKVMQGDPTVTLTNMSYVSYQGGVIVNPAPTVDDTDGVRVTRTYNVPHIMSRVFGTNGTDISVSGTAIIGAPPCMDPDIPLTLVVCDDNGGKRHL